MYHVNNNKRCINTATTIYHSLRHLLFTKKLSEITITDIHNESGVSRMTFYRLFDTTSDVLMWKLAEFVNEYNTLKIDKDDKLLFFFEYWKHHFHLISLLADQSKNVLFDLFSKNIDINDPYSIYLVNIKISIMSSLLASWASRNGKETPSEMKEITLKIFSNNADILTNI